MQTISQDYKYTELGNIPADWEVKELGEICMLKSGKTITSKNITELDIYPCYGGNGLRGYTSNYTHNGAFALIGRQGALCGNIQFTSGKFFASEHAVVVSPAPHTNIKWLSYELIRMNLSQYSESSAQPGLSVSKLLLLPVPLPPLPEQIRIATILSDMDAFLTAAEKLLQKKKAIKQGLMQELLTPKEGWEVKELYTLTKIFTKQTGFDYSAYIKPSLVQQKKDEDISFIQNKDFNNKCINFNTDYFIPKSVAIQFPKILLDEKCLLISISGSVGNVGVFDSPKLAFIGGAVAILKFKNPSLIDWVMFYLKSDEGQKKLLNNVKAGSHQNLTLADIRKIQILFPTLSEQIRIATILSDADAEIQALEAKLSKYRLLKQGMMHNLLTGKIRV